MKSFVKWFDESPLWLKIIFALPVIDIVWAVYRIVKGAAYGKIWTLIGGILWIVQFCGLSISFALLAGNTLKFWLNAQREHLLSFFILN